MDKIEKKALGLFDLLNNMNNGSKIVIKKIDNKYIVTTSVISEFQIEDISI